MKKNILIIEDNTELVDIYTTRFENAGFKVFSSHNGLDAMVILASESIDLIILDLMMPQMNGFEVLESIKNNFSNEKTQIPIVIWSNLSQEYDKEKAMRMGASLYLAKSSYSGDDLVKTITRFLEKNT
jgi:DNA-binding response OmpR family regulator